VTGGSAAALGQAPAFAMDMTYVAMADSIGMAMANAVANQQRAQTIGGAALAQVLT
jgi:Killing trait